MFTVPFADIENKTHVSGIEEKIKIDVTTHAATATYARMFEIYAIFFPAAGGIFFLDTKTQ